MKLASIILITLAIAVPLLLALLLFLQKKTAGRHTGRVKLLWAGGSVIEASLLIAIVVFTGSLPFLSKEKKEPEGFYRTPDTGEETVSDAKLADGSPATIRLDSETGTPAFLTGDITPAEGNSPEEKALWFFNTNKDLYKMSDPAAQLSRKREEGDAQGGTHLHMDQTYKDIPVYGSELAVHFSKAGNIVAVNGRFVPETDVSVEPRVSMESAVSTAQSDLGSEAQPSQVEGEAPRLVIFAPDRTDPRLTWQIILMADDPAVRMVYFIDAESGEVAAKYDDLQEVRNREMYSAKYGDTDPEDGEKPKDPTFLYGEKGPGLIDLDKAANTTFDNIGQAYAYFNNTFGRDNYNNKNGTVTVSIVHYRWQYENAFWSGSRFVFGDGNYPLLNSNAYGMSRDIVGHEYTHAVTSHSAGLIYADQSGALNESFSDVFACMIDRDDWLIGEDLHPVQINQGIRSLADPKSHGQPDNASEYKSCWGDPKCGTDSLNGGVHINSGIPNKAAYNVATELSARGKDGRKELEQIWYHALTLYLTYHSQFTDARDACVQSARDLYPDTTPGVPSIEVRVVEKAFADVGIKPGNDRIQTTARIQLTFPQTNDINIYIGVGKPEAPSCSVYVNGADSVADGTFANIDVFKCVQYLPPTNSNRWFLKVVNKGNNEGSIEDFTITDHGQTYLAYDNPTPIKSNSTAVSQIPSLRKAPPKPSAQSDTVFIMDVSGSMSDSMKGGRKIDASEDATRYYLSMIKNQDTAQGGLNRAALVEFSDAAKLDQKMGADQDTLERAVSAMEPQNSTNMGDGLQKALRELSSIGAGRERMIILLSDGQSNAGMSNEEIINGPVAVARREGIKIYTVGFGSASSTGGSGNSNSTTSGRSTTGSGNSSNSSSSSYSGYGDIDEALLKQIADQTGGEYYFADEAYQLGNIYISLRQRASGREIADMAGTASGGSQQVGAFSVDITNGELHSTINWEDNRAQMQLHDPEGRIVDSEYPGAIIFEESRPAYVVVKNPLPGTWSAYVEPEKGSESTYNIIISAQEGTHDLSQYPLALIISVSLALILSACAFTFLRWPINVTRACTSCGTVNLKSDSCCAECGEKLK